MKPALLRLAAGLAIAVALAGGAQAQATLKVKASTTAAMAGKCIAATTLFAKISEGEAKEGDERPMTDMALTWLTDLQGRPEPYQTAALAEMKVTAEGYGKAVEKSNTEGLTAIAGDVAGCILEME